MQRPRLSYANVTSTLALVLAVSGGTAYAAATIGSKNIKAHAVTNSKLASNAVTGTKVKAGSLSSSDFASGQLPAGPTGPAGPAGPAGAAATNLSGTVNSFGTLVFGSGITATSNQSPGVYFVTFNRSVQSCTSVGTVGGYFIGGNTQGPQGGTLVINGAGDTNPNTVFVVTRDTTGASVNLPFHIAAFC